MFILGVTGTSGSGKTLFCAYLSELGAAVIDCDQVYHELLRSSSQLNSDIISIFPEVEKDGLADRAALAKIVFSDRSLLKKLEDAVFPHITSEISQIIEGLKNDGAALCVLDAPTLFESGADRLCSHVIAIIADKEAQIERLNRREGLSREQALARIDSRPGEEFFKERGCEIIYNNGDIDSIMAQAKRVYIEISGKGE